MSKKKKLKKDLKELIMMIAQADTNAVIRNTGPRGQYLIDAAKELTTEYKFFPYWD